MKVNSPLVPDSLTVASPVLPSLSPVALRMLADPVPLVRITDSVIVLLKPVSTMFWAFTARTTGTVVNAFAAPLWIDSGTGCCQNVSAVAITSEVTAFDVMVARSLPTPSWSLAVSWKLCWSADAL